MESFERYVFMLLILLTINVGCSSSNDQPTQPDITYKLDGVWQSYIFNSNYPFTQFIAHLRTVGTEVRGEIQSDCFDIFLAKQIPFTINSGSYTDNDISFNFSMESVKIYGHFLGNIKDNSDVQDGKEIVGHVYFEYSGTLTNFYPLHMKKQSILFLPKKE